MKSKSISLMRGAVSLVSAWILIFLLLFLANPVVSYLSRRGGTISADLQGAARELGYAARGEYTELSVYKDNAVLLFRDLYGKVTSAAFRADPNSETETRFDSRYRDILYRCEYFREDGTVYVLANAEPWDGSDVLPPDFNYSFSYVGGEVFIERNGVTVYESAVPYTQPYTRFLSYLLEDYRRTNGSDRVSVRFAVRERETTPFGASGVRSAVIGETEQAVQQTMFWLAVAAAAALLFLLILIFAIVFRRDRKAFVRRIGECLGRIWFEVKLILLVIGACVAREFWYYYGYDAKMTGICIVLVLAALVVTDLRVNRRVWRQSLVAALMRAVRGTGHGFSSRLSRTYVFLGAALACTVLFGALSVTFLATRWGHPVLLLLAVILFAFFFFGLLSAFGLFLREDLSELDELFRQIEQLYKGDLDAVNRLPMQSPLHVPAMQLNMIRDGIRFAVAQGAQSERTKVELITNVSHDLKTPLTSIISYVDLLESETDLPAEAQEYVGVIRQKADRLAHMVQDIFDISKAATGNLPLHIERISMDKLLRQTIAEMDALLQDGRLIWRVQIPEAECMILADGQKLYRIFQNLIKNASQYALTGSRVYLSLFPEEQKATVQIQNVTAQEMELDGERLTARFVRGDGSREGSGSGLGLSIAKSFTESMGGTFRVYVHGNIFTAEVAFPLAGPKQEQKNG